MSQQGTAYAPVLHRLASLYERSQRLRSEDAKAFSSLPVLGPSPYVWRDPTTIPTRLEGVTDARSGTRYAAWVIGETLCTIGGLGLMREVSALFTDQHGALAS